jgi:hypothetical protein
LIGNVTITVEASFPYNHDSIECTDSFSDNLTEQTEGAVDVEQVGTYVLKYKAFDQAGNCYDGTSRADNGHVSTCYQQQHQGLIVRTVVVVDTLTPVIALKYRDSLFALPPTTDHSKTQEHHRNPADRFFLTSSADNLPTPEEQQFFIEDYSTHFERGIAPYIKPDYHDTDNPRNLQPSLQACKDQCESIAGCRYGTFITSAARVNECWLSAHTGSVDVACGVSCASFDKVAYSAPNLALLVVLDPTGVSNFVVASVLAAAVVVAGRVSPYLQTSHPQASYPQV